MGATKKICNLFLKIENCAKSDRLNYAVHYKSCDQFEA